MGKSLPMPQPKEDQEPEEYQVKDAADTLMRAEEIKRDKKLMPHVHKHLNKKLKSLKELKQQGLKMAAGQNDNDEDDQ